MRTPGKRWRIGMAQPDCAFNSHVGHSTEKKASSRVEEIQ